MRLSPRDKQPTAAALSSIEAGQFAEYHSGWDGRGASFRRLWAPLIALAPALLFLPIVLAPPLNHDVAAVLDFSQRWLGGERLYADLIDVNPPLIFVLNLLPAALARHAPLSGPAALQICVLGFGLVCWRLAFRVRDRAGEGPVTRAFLDVLPAMLLLGAGYDFGQREHLMAVGALPYILCAARRAARQRSAARIASAVVAGAAFAIKPYFLAMPALIELAVLAGIWRGRPGLAGLGVAVALRLWIRDPVPVVMAGIWLAYATAIALFFSDYLYVVAPLAWGLYLDIGGQSFLQVLLTPRLGAAALLLACLLIGVFRRPLSRGEELPRMLGLAGLGALVSALAQHKGWSYHVLPVELFACSLAAVMIARRIDRAGAFASGLRPGFAAAALTALMAVYCVSAGEAPWKELRFSESPAGGLTRLLDQLAPGQRVLVLSPGIYPIYPALNYAGAHAAMREMNMWILQGAYEQCLPGGRRYREPSEMGRAESFLFRTVSEVFARARPAAVVVDKQPGIPWCGEEFDFVAYFSRNPLFAETWLHYQLRADWDRYRIYTRRD